LECNSPSLSSRSRREKKASSFEAELFFTIPKNPVLAVGIPLSLGFISAIPTKTTVESVWYNTLNAPPGRPSPKVFPIVWTVLYTGMGYASHLAVKALDRGLLSPASANSARSGIKLYWAQLALNLLWSPLFFGMRQPALALVDSIALTAITIKMTADLDGPTGGASTLLLLPYCAWLGFATYINGGIWWLNRNQRKRN